MCKKIASVIAVDDANVQLNVSCVTHGNTFPPLDLPMAAIPAFLEEGQFAVAIGAVPRETYDVIRQAFEDAGFAPRLN